MTDDKTPNCSCVNGNPGECAGCSDEGCKCTNGNPETCEGCVPAVAGPEDGDTLNPEENARRRIKNARIALMRVNKDRAEGLKKLEFKVQDLMDSEVVNVDGVQAPANVVRTFRDLIGAINASFLVLEAQNNLADMIISDMINLSQQLEMQKHNAFMTSAHLETLMAVLEADGVITEEKMKTAWETIVASKMRDLAEKEGK